jgi:hypothetical protein
MALPGKSKHSAYLAEIERHLLRNADEPVISPVLLLSRKEPKEDRLWFLSVWVRQLKSPAVPSARVSRVCFLLPLLQRIPNASLAGRDLHPETRAQLNVAEATLREWRGKNSGADSNPRLLLEAPLTFGGRTETLEKWARRISKAHAAVAMVSLAPVWIPLGVNVFLLRLYLGAFSWAFFFSLAIGLLLALPLLLAFFNGTFMLAGVAGRLVTELRAHRFVEFVSRWFIVFFMVALFFVPLVVAFLLSKFGW